MRPDLPYHNSSEAWLELRDVPASNHVRPTGLWWARGTTWLDYASTANPQFARVYPHVFELSLVGSNILTIDSERIYDWFTYRYGRTDVRWIDWSAVAKEYDGVEISEPRLIQRRNWSTSWDVISGCCWNATKIQVVGYREERRSVAKAKSTSGLSTSLKGRK